MKRDVERSDSRAKLAAVALAGGATVRDAATAAGLSESTVYRLLRRPAFVARVNELRDAVLAAAMSRLVQNATLAADVLVGLLNHADARTRLAAARSILMIGPHIRSQVDDEARVRALESERHRYDEV
jgi:hypothetical protein